MLLLDMEGRRPVFIEFGCAHRRSFLRVRPKNAMETMALKRGNTLSTINTTLL